jgi:hypothetical protein
MDCRAAEWRARHRYGMACGDFEMIFKLKQRNWSGGSIRSLTTRRMDSTAIERRTGSKARDSGVWWVPERDECETYGQCGRAAVEDTPTLARPTVNRLGDYCCPSAKRNRTIAR